MNLRFTSYEERGIFCGLEGYFTEILSLVFVIAVVVALAYSD